MKTVRPGNGNHKDIIVPMLVPIFKACSPLAWSRAWSSIIPVTLFGIPGLMWAAAPPLLVIQLCVHTL